MTNAFNLGDVVLWCDKIKNRSYIKLKSDYNLEYYNTVAFEEYPDRYEYEVLTNLGKKNDKKQGYKK